MAIPSVLIGAIGASTGIIIIYQTLMRDLFIENIPLKEMVLFSVVTSVQL